MPDVTIKTIAQEAGVSPSLVSLVLNGRPVRVSDETRRRIVEVARKNHYVPNQLASFLKSRRPNIIALLAPFTPNGFFSNLIYHVQRYVQKAGYFSMVINTFNSPERECEALELYQSGIFAGMLVAPRTDSLNIDVLTRMQADGFPFVYIDRFQPAVSGPVVMSDHHKVGYELTENLISQGRRKLAYIYSASDANTTLHDRKQGFCDALSDNALEAGFISFSAKEGGDDGTVQAICDALSAYSGGYDALFVHSGFYIPSVLKALEISRLPLRELDIVTVDGFNFSEAYLSIPGLLGHLSGHCRMVLQNFDEIARCAVELLMKRMDGSEEDTRLISSVKTVDF